MTRRMARGKRLRTLIYVCATVCALWTLPALAQGQSKPQPASKPQEKRQADSSDKADISFTATVKARELRFEVVPNTKVEFTGTQGNDTSSKADRENLPDSVQPGVTYRDIGVRLVIRSIFPDIDRIVSEALGEKPATDVKPEQKAEPSKPPQPSTTRTRPKKPAGGRQR